MIVIWCRRNNRQQTASIQLPFTNSSPMLEFCWLLINRHQIRINSSLLVRARPKLRRLASKPDPPCIPLILVVSFLMEASAKVQRVGLRPNRCF